MPSTMVWQDNARELDREELIWHYTHGRCGVLAQVLNQQLGWPLWGIFGGLWSDPGTPCHVFVQNPATKLFADAFGAEKSEDNLIRPYKNLLGKVYIQALPGNSYFQRDPSEYVICLQEHVERLLPGLLPTTTGRLDRFGATQ